jgi:hypothetical protein
MTATAMPQIRKYVESKRVFALACAVADGRDAIRRGEPTLPVMEAFARNLADIDLLADALGVRA